MKRTIHSSSKEWDPDSHRDSPGQTSQAPTKEAANSIATSSRGVDGDLWDEFVRENWAPALEIDFGPDWRDKFSEEVIAILWWAVKNRNRFPGAPPGLHGSEDMSGGLMGSLPPLAGFPQSLSHGMANPMVQGMHEHQATSAPLVFGSFKSGPSGEVSSPIQVPFPGLPLFGVDNPKTSVSSQTQDGLDLNGGSALPLVEKFEDAPCMDLPDIGDPPFANDDDDDTEGPSTKMQRLLDPSLDLPLNIEPMFGNLTIDGNSEDDLLDSRELVRAVMETEIAGFEDEEVNPGNPLELQEEVRIPAPRPEKLKVKRTGGVKRQGEDLSIQDQQGGAGSTSLMDPPDSGIQQNGVSERLNDRGASPGSSQGKQPRVSAELDSRTGGQLSSHQSFMQDAPYDPEHPGLGLGNVMFCGSSTQPFGSIDPGRGGFTFAGTENGFGKSSGKKDVLALDTGGSIDSGDFGSCGPDDSQTSVGGEYEKPSTTSGSAWSYPQGFQKSDMMPGEPQKKAQKHRETDISGQGASSHTSMHQAEPWPQAVPGVKGQPFDAAPQFSDVSTGRPIAFGAQSNMNNHPSQLAPAVPSGALPLPVNSVLRLGYCGIYPTPAWGVAAGQQQQQQQQPPPLPQPQQQPQQQPQGRVPGAPMFCVPSTLPSQFGVPLPVMGVGHNDSVGSSGQRGIPSSQPGVMPAMYVMDNRHIIDGTDALGRCPVHVAAMAGRDDIIDQLIHVGCDCSKVLPIDILGASKKGNRPQEALGNISSGQASGCLPGLMPPAGMIPSAPPCGMMPSSSQGGMGSPPPGLVTSPSSRSGPSQAHGAPPPLLGSGPNLGPPGPPVSAGLPRSSHPQSLPPQARLAPQLQVERDPGVDELSFKYANALHLAGYYGHINVAELLLSNNRCDPQARNEHGCTPLHFAANRGKRQVMERLLKVQGMKIDLADVHGRTALHHAAAQGHADIIDELWPRGCKFDAVDVRGWTALHYAAHAGHTEVVGKLVIAGCPVTKFDNRGYTPAHLAAQGGYDKVLEKLLHAGYDPDTLGGMTILHGCGGSTALHMASACGHANVVQQLLREGSHAPKEDFRGFSALQCAAEGGHFEAFIKLLDAGCDPKAHDCCGTTVLHSAAKGGNWDIIRKLLALGCDHSLQTKFGCTALHHAAQGGAYQVAQNLLNLGCDIHVQDKDGNMPWHAAAEGGNLKVLELFLDKGCELEARNSSGCTALHCAARSGSVGAVQALMDRNADIRAVSDDGQTALHYSMETGHEKIVSLLLEKLDTITINLQEKNGWTVLHHAADKGNTQMVKVLIERGAQINAQTKQGRTALHLSTRSHHQGVAEVLLRAGCETGVRDIDGCTPLHYAAQRSNLPLFNLLFKTAGCKVGENDTKGYTLLHYAVEGGNPEIVGQLVFTGAAKSDSINGGSNIMNALHLACKLGNAAVIPYLFNAGYKVNAKGPDGREPLHFAARGNCVPWSRKESTQHYHVVKMLLENGADPHAVDDKGCHALMYAAGSGDLEMVFKFLTMGVDCKRTDENDWTAMHWAATSGIGEVVTQLLKSGIPANTPDKQGRIPLHWAAERGHIESVRAILEVMVQNKADIHTRDYSDKTPAQLAASKGHVEVVAKLLESGKTKDVKCLTALHLAAQMQLEEVTKLLLSTGKCDVNSRDADGCTPLHYAADNGNATIVAQLLEAGADLNITSADGMMPIHKAASEGHLGAVDKLIGKGALNNFCTSTGSTPLHYAASTGKIDVLERLIKEGCPVNAMSTGSVSCTALYCAASNGQVEAVDMLLNTGAEVDTICTNDCTALHVAASNGHAKAVKRLLDAGADMDLQAANGAAAIHNAVNNGHLEALEVLLVAECDVDVQNSAGNNALHIAALKGSQELTKLLLGSECDVHIKNAKGWQAVHSAASNGFFDVVLMLVQHGAQWRQKGDLDVAKLLCRKSNLKNSYVEGRLRLAERERHRKAKPAEVTEVVPSEAELKEKMAQADAAMAALLQEEEEQKEEEEAKKARREAKRDKKKKKKDASLMKAKEGDGEEKQKDAVSLEGSIETNAAEDELSGTAEASELETITSFSALSLSDSVGQPSANANRQSSGSAKKSGKKKNRKKMEPSSSARMEAVRIEATPDRETPEASSGNPSSRGTVKIIRCHNAGTPVINPNKQPPSASTASASTSAEVQNRPTKALKQLPEQRKEPQAPVRVLSVPKSQIVLVNRSKRRISDSGDSNGVSTPHTARRTAESTTAKNPVASSIQAMRSISSVVRSTHVPGATLLSKPAVAAPLKVAKNVHAARPVVGPTPTPVVGSSPLGGIKPAAPASTSVWQRPSPSITKPAVVVPKPSFAQAAVPSQPVVSTTSQPSSLLSKGRLPSATAIPGTQSASRPVKPTSPIDNVLAGSEAVNGGKDASVSTISTSGVLKRTQAMRDAKTQPGHLSSSLSSGEKHASPGTKRAWGPPGSMQGMRPPQATGPFGSSAWATGSGRPGAGGVDASKASTTSFFPPTSAPGVGFPFPGRRESWGQPSGGAFLPGMHSGLGEQIVLPKGDQGFADTPGQGVGETASDFLRRQAQLRISQASDSVPWPNQGFLHTKTFQPLMKAPEAPFPGMAQRLVPATLSNTGDQPPERVRLSGISSTSPSPWTQNTSILGTQPNGIGTAEAVVEQPVHRHTLSNMSDTPWEVGNELEKEPEMQAIRRRVPPPPPGPPKKMAGRNQFCCPLTDQLMRDPVVAADGFTYERSAIEAWLSKNDKSPVSHKTMMHKDLVPNLTMRAAINLQGPIRK